MSFLKEILEAIINLKRNSIVTIDSQNLAATTDYAAKDVLSNSATAGRSFAFDNAVRKKGGTGTIEKAIAYCSVTGLTPRITLYLFNAKPTGTLNDNAANNSPVLADHPSFEGQIDFLAAEDLGGGSTSVVTVGTYGNLALPFHCAEKTLYSIAVTRDAITGEVAGMVLSFKLQIKWD